MDINTVLLGHEMNMDAEQTGFEQWAREYVPDLNLEIVQSSFQGEYLGPLYVEFASQAAWMAWRGRAARGNL